MRINLRQEIAMWVLGGGWTGLALRAFMSNSKPGDALIVFVVEFVLLMPIFLVIFSLRDRGKPN
jgi:hypothetical protein